MKLTIWGTRGSIPAPGDKTVQVGGNTTCMEIEPVNGPRIIIDAGTGIRTLGMKLMKDADPDPIVLLLTHSHWDHLAGFTFFQPAYNPNFSIDVYGNKMAKEVLKRDIFDRHDNRYFPVNMDDFRAKFTFHDELPDPFEVGDISISTMDLNHPGNGYAYKFEHAGKSIVFATDNELGKQYPGGNSPQDIRDFCQNVDLLLHDAQYLPSEIQNHIGWGHSTYEEVLNLAADARIKHVTFIHHDPERDDDGCHALLEDAKKYEKSKKYNIECELGIEGASFTV
ncbi:MBL fold metallo-hydrolase [Calditrichota bacterium]